MTQKKFSTDLHKIRWKVGAFFGPQKKPLDVGGNSDHVTLG